MPLGTVQALIPVGQRAQDIAEEVWDVTEWPVQDLAGIFEWDVAALTWLLFGLKLMSVGWHLEQRRVSRR